MNTAHRIVTKLPLTEVWCQDGFTTTMRIRHLTAVDITSLLRVGRVQFVVADLGLPLHWVPVDECYDFWKTEVRLHLALPESRVVLEDFPDGYCYFAFEWSGRDDIAPIVVCERQH
jgi:hypothetical protein